MSVRAEIQHGCLVAVLAGEIDLHDAKSFQQQADCILAESGIRCLIVDMAAVDFIDSSGIGALIGRYKRLKLNGGKMILVGLKPSVARLLRLAGVLGILEVCDDMEGAFNKA